MKDSVLWRHPYQAESYEQLFEASSVDTDGFELVEEDSQNALFYEWYRAILREPVMVALLDLAESEGPWVGTEAGLFDKVRELTPAKAQKSGPFPSTPEELLGHVDDVHEHSWAFSAAGLVVLDRRKLTGEEAGAFDVPGWGLEHPLLVATEDAASERPLFYEALLGLARYEKPLLVAALRSTRNRPHWSGTTRQMQARLWAYYPDNRAEGYGWIFRAAEWADDLEGFSVDDRALEDAAYTSPYSGPHDPFRLLDHSLDEWIGSK